ncbi:hypothetical protein LENED_001979 [Lentinula edodes]|uniref:Uncharacterized protein n=1 Tax=Lentinula edodes TaxID=5353 RepID=A0A1Q3DZL6_LENED|nr:hypothetical protein LENED_001979 [Lentinula edodes]
MASTTASLGDEAIAAKLFRPNATSRLDFALDEFFPDVFWDKMVPMIDWCSFLKQGLFLKATCLVSGS